MLLYFFFSVAKMHKWTDRQRKSPELKHRKQPNNSSIKNKILSFVLPNLIPLCCFDIQVPLPLYVIQTQNS